MKKTAKCRLYGGKRKKIERMFIVKNLSKCPLSVKKLVQGLIKENAKLRKKNFRLLKEKEAFKKRSLVLRKELLEKCHLNRKLQEQLNRKKVRENTISLPN